MSTEIEISKHPEYTFELIKEGKLDIVDKLLKEDKIDINLCDNNGNNILVWLLRVKAYDLVLEHMSNPKWDVNNQNKDGNTFAHFLVKINYVDIMDILLKLKKNKKFMPNLKNNLGETILDKSINGNYIYTTVKIIEDNRFDNIGIVSFKNLYDTYINSSKYGKYSKLTNLDIIIDSLDNKKLVPIIKIVIDFIKDNYKIIKEEVIKNNKSRRLDLIINNAIKEVRSNA